MEQKLLANATVTLEGKNHSIVKETNSKGEVQFKDVPPDTYTVLVTKEGYQEYLLPKPLKIHKNKKNNHHHNIRLDPIKKDKIIEKDTRTLIIQTRVSNAEVSLVSLDSDDGETKKTNKKGEIIFKEVPFGNYEIIITKTGYHTFNKDILVNSNNKFTRKIRCKLQPILVEE